MDSESFQRLVADYKDRTIANKYRILSGLGYGNFAAVFLGYESFRKRLVAVKRFVIPRCEVEQVIGEVNGMDVLAGKPNVVQFFGYEVEQLEEGEQGPGEDNIRFYIVMAYGGQTLEAYLNRYGLKEEDPEPSGDEGLARQIRAYLLARDILRGLEGSHRERIIHRDIKPLNVYVSLDGIARIGDFGVAKQVLQEGLHSGTIIGTMHYMAPEQMSGEKYGANVDLFATGVTLYRMLTGRLPFKSLAEIMTKQQDMNLPGLSPAAIGVLDRSLQKQPEHRYADAQEMLSDLDQWGAELKDACAEGFAPERERIRANVREILGEEILEHIRDLEPEMDNPPPPEEEPLAGSIRGRAPESEGTVARTILLDREIKDEPPAKPTEADSERPFEERIAKPLVPIVPGLAGAKPERREMKNLRASDKALVRGDLAVSIDHLKQAVAMDGSVSGFAADQLQKAQLVLQWEQRTREEIDILVSNKELAKAEARIRPILGKYEYSTLKQKLAHILEVRGANARLLERACRLQEQRRYGKAVRLYRRVLDREPYIEMARRNLQTAKELRSRSRRRSAVRLAWTTVAVIVLVFAVYHFRSRICPICVEIGAEMQREELYTSPPILNARDFFRLAALLDQDNLELQHARNLLKGELVRKAQQAQRHRDNTIALDFYRQALLVDPDDETIKENIEKLTD